jgi:hypothetical protein
MSQALIIMSTFPSTPSIPPASFYNLQGLAGWLNQNSSYKKYFVGQTDVSPYLLPITSSLSSFSLGQYDPANVPLTPFVTTLSQQQLMQYSNQISLFRKVYAYNSNAYVNYVSTATVSPSAHNSPIYYRFVSYQEYTQYKAAVALVNKLYPFTGMANQYLSGNVIDPLNTYPDQSWVIPFPL